MLLMNDILKRLTWHERRVEKWRGMSKQLTNDFVNENGNCMSKQLMHDIVNVMATA